MVVLLCLSSQYVFFFSNSGEDGHRSTAKPTELSWTLGTGHLDSGQWMVDSYKNVFINVFPTSGKTPPLRFAVWSFGQFDGFLLLQIKSPPIILSDSQIICSKHTISSFRDHYDKNGKVPAVPLGRFSKRYFQFTL